MIAVMALMQPSAESAVVLKGFIDEYTEAWNSADVAAIVEAYATPCFVVKGGRVLRHGDQAARHRDFSELVTSNQREGMHTWSVGNLERTHWVATLP
jgi:ketosteroid isomerase-like protein